MMKYCVVSLFPGYMESPLRYGVLGRAIQRGDICITNVDMRECLLQPTDRCDDQMYGSGAGMVLSADVVIRAVKQAKEYCPNAPVVFVSPRGKTLDNKLARALATYNEVIFLSGHYEGIDARGVESVVDIEISVGNFIVSNGNLPILTCIDAISRFIPGVVGDKESVERDSYENHGYQTFSVYTRPDRLPSGEAVPNVLITGHHRLIDIWRKCSCIFNSIIKWHREELSTEEFLMKKGISSYSNVAIVEMLQKYHHRFLNDDGLYTISAILLSLASMEDSSDAEIKQKGKLYKMPIESMRLIHDIIKGRFSPYSCK